jgi:DNA-binding transcriptional LysR family regulator
MRPEIRQLDYFVTLAQELNFTRAAQRLNVVQQTLSGGIAQLERLLGLRLFERSTRHVRLTAAGAELLPVARQALAAVDALVAAAELSRSGHSGRLAVGLSSTSGLAATPRLLGGFSERFPGVELAMRHFDFTDPYAGLLSAETDVALVRPPFSADGLDLVPIGSEDRYVVLPAGHRLAGHSSVPFTEIEDEPWMDVDTDAAWCAFWSAQDHRRRAMEVGAICNSLADLFEAARVGRTAGFVPESVARSQAWPGLAFVRVADVEPSVVAVGSRTGDERPAVTGFLELARTVGQAAPPA